MILQAMMGLPFFLLFAFAIAFCLFYVALLLWYGTPDTEEKRKKMIRKAGIFAGCLVVLLLILISLPSDNPPIN